MVSPDRNDVHSAAKQLKLFHFWPDRTKIGIRVRIVVAFEARFLYPISRARRMLIDLEPQARCLNT